MTELLSTITHKYDVKTKLYSIGSEQIKITMVADTNRLLDDIVIPKAEGERSEQSSLETNFPFWAELWSSAIALSRYIWHHVDLQNTDVLELGCGLGMVGIVAAKNGARVLMTDYSADALLFAQYNAKQNHCVNVGFRRLDWRCPDLDCHESLTTKVKSLTTKVKSLQHDKFPYILASDVIYEEENWRLLINIFKTNLKACGEIILAEPNRPDAPGFFELLRRNGFCYTHRLEIILMDGRTHRISIYRIRKVWD